MPPHPPNAQGQLHKMNEKRVRTRGCGCVKGKSVFKATAGQLHIEFIAVKTACRKSEDLCNQKPDKIST